MFKLNERGVIFSGVFYGLLLLFLFLVLAIVVVLSNGRLALKAAKDNAINELNSKTILLERISLDDSNTVNGSYLTNSVDRSLLDVSINLSDTDITSDTKTTILVTVYNTTKNAYIFKGIKDKNFNANEIDNYPQLDAYTIDNNIIIDTNSYSSLINTTVNPYSTITIPITFKYKDISNVSANSVRAYILFNFTR